MKRKRKEERDSEDDDDDDDECKQESKKRRIESTCIRCKKDSSTFSYGICSKCLKKCDKCSRPGKECFNVYCFNEKEIKNNKSVSVPQKSVLCPKCELNLARKRDEVYQVCLNERGFYFMGYYLCEDCHLSILEFSTDNPGLMEKLIEAYND